MKLVRRTRLGMILRALSMIWRKRSPEPPRFMRLRTLAEACCSGTSRYFAMLSWRAMDSSRREVILLG